MKVAIAHPTSSLTSGASWSLLYLAKNLKQSGIDVVIILEEYGLLEKKLEENDVRYYVIKQYNQWCWFDYVNLDYKKDIIFKIKLFIKKYILNKIAQIRIMYILKKEKIEIVHMNCLTSFLTANVAKRFRIKLIWHIREFMEEDLGLKFTNYKHSVRLINQADDIIAISKSIKDKYKNIFNKNINVIYNGINVETYFNKKEILLHKIINIAITGRITEGKGQLELLEAINILPKEVKNSIKCFIIGDIEDKLYYQQLQEKIQHYSLNNIIKFTGFSKDISNIMKDIDISCICSKQEAFGRITIESMLAGTLVIGSNSGGTLELINDKNDGYIYISGDSNNLANVITYVYYNRDLSKQVAINGQEKALKYFTDKKNSDNIIKIYKRNYYNERNNNA